jgi:hypothetical protein
VKRFIGGVSAVEVSWIIVAIALVWVLYFLAVNQLRSTAASWKVVLRWIAGLGGWFFVMYIFGWDRIKVGGLPSMALGLLSASLAFFSVFIIRDKDANWQQIISGTIIIIIGFTIATTIAIGAQAYSYSIFFGCLGGMILGMLIISIRRMQRAPSEPSGKSKGSSGEWKDSRPKEL